MSLIFIHTPNEMSVINVDHNSYNWVLPFMLPAVRRELKQRLKEAQLAARKIFSFL